MELQFVLYVMITCGSAIGLVHNINATFCGIYLSFIKLIVVCVRGFINLMF